VDEPEHELKRETERWFVRRGLPHFIDHYNAREDIFTRAAPFLSVVFVAGLFSIQFDAGIRWWQNVLSIGAGLVLGLGLFALINRARGRRFFQRPDRIGAPELATFILVPTVAQLIIVSTRAAAVTASLNIALLAITYIVTSYGLIPMARWAVVQMFRAFRQVTNLFVRSLPLLLLFTMFMFFNADLWKITDDIPVAFLWTAIATMVLVGTAFILLRFPQELSALAAFETWDEVRAEAAGSPLANVDLGALERQGDRGDGGDGGDRGAHVDGSDRPVVPRLKRRARVNVGLVLLFSQAVQVLLVTLTIFGFYMAFGMFTVLQSTIVQWSGSAAIDAIWTFDYFDHPVVITGELVRSSLLVAAIAGLQFAVSAAVDSTYRDEFFRGLIDELRTSLATRALYLKLLTEPV